MTTTAVRLKEIKDQHKWGVENGYLNLDHSDIEWLIKQAEENQEKRFEIEELNQYIKHQKNQEARLLALLKKAETHLPKEQMIGGGN